MSACPCSECVDRQRAEMARAQVLASLAMLRAIIHAQKFLACPCSECEEERVREVMP